MNHPFLVKEPVITKILRWAVYASAFTPLIIFSQFISPFHFGKIIVFRSAIEIMAVLYIVLIIKNKSYIFPRTKLFWAVTIFTAVFGLTTFTSISFYPSFWGTLERMGGWYSFIHFWVFFVITSSVLKRKTEWLFFLKLILIASLLSTFYGFLQKTSWNWIIGSGGRTKIFGTLGNPALFAGYTLVCGFLALTLSRLASFKSWAPFLYSTFILNSLAVLLTGVRGSVIALVVGLGIFGFMYSSKIGQGKIKKYTIVFLVIVVLSAGSLYLMRNATFVKSNSYLARYSDISLSSQTVKTRFWAWQAGFDGLNDSFRSFIVGYGPENFNIPFSKHFNPKFFSGPGSETLFDRAHNQFFEVLFTMGFAGFTAYLLIFIYAIESLRRIRSESTFDLNEINVLKIGLLTTLIVYSIHNSFIFDTSANYLIFFVVLGFINFLSTVPNKEEPSMNGKDKNLNKTIQRKSRGGLAYFVGAIIAIPMLALIYLTNIEPIYANYATTRAIILGWQDKIDLAVDKFKEALSYNTFGKYEIRHRFAQFVLENPGTDKIDAKITEKFLMAADYVKKNTQEFPQDYLPYLYMSRIYITLGKTDKNSPYNDLALENGFKALAISETFVRTYYEIAQAYLNKQDYKKAVEIFEKAIQLNPNVALSWWYKGLTQIEAGDSKSGFNTLETAYQKGYNFKKNEADLRRLANIFIKQKDYLNLVKVYEYLVEASPENVDYHVLLATAYVQIGKLDLAVEQAKKAAELDPSFEAEARVFVQNLGKQW